MSARRTTTVRRFTCWTVSALHVDNGATVRIYDGTELVAAGLVGAAHYAGPYDGSGIVTLELVGQPQWQGPATTRVEVTR